MARILECVPNFSEGRDQAVIDRITAAIEAVDGVSLLDVDPGAATNRTVVTFAGEPEAVLDAAVAGAKVAAELIDMSRHHGEHPRFGAMDVCPLVPIAGLDLEEAAAYARTLAARLGEEVGLTIYCYEHAAQVEERRNLAVVRAGEYEGLEARLREERWKPDFGPAEFQPRTGATAVGARDFLVAYNVNLNTTSTRRANAIAFDVRERGRIKRAPDPLTGEVVRDEAGDPVWTPGTLKAVKGIGWFIEEFGVCQVSMNLNDIGVTPVHVAYDEVLRAAAARGVRVTGSELVGLIPLRAMLDAGRHYLRMQQRSTGVADAELIKIAVKSMGLDELYPFKPEEKIVEYVLAANEARKLLVDRSVRGFVEETASESPAPGGGSVAATVGALGAALGTMVANLSSHKRGWDARWEEFSDWAEKGKACQDELLALVDRDTDAFHAIMASWRLPEGGEAEKAAKAEAVQAAVAGAIEVPLRIMEVARDSMEVAEAMAADGLQASLSDAGVGMLCARTAVLGAWYNVRINAGDLEDEARRAAYLERAAAIAAEAESREAALRATVEARLG
ncbi:MAG: glutamate formimidoyltransferase [Planctomycetota bacterium]|jgi:glutamate formiminotransferase/formiminotetrahydrofolate cyclodeaminase